MVTIVPDSTSEKVVEWSSDRNVATIDAIGKVAAVTEGTATITAITKDGGKTATHVHRYGI